MLIYTPIKKEKATRLVCPACKERVPRVSLLAGSKIEGLAFECKKCQSSFSVKTE